MFGTSSTSRSLGERVLGQDLVLHTILQHLTNMNDLRTVQGLVSLYACKMLSKEALRLHLARHEGRQWGVHFGEFEHIGKDPFEFLHGSAVERSHDDYGSPEGSEVQGFTVQLSEYLGTKGSVVDIRERIKRMHERNAIELPSHRKKLKSMKTKKEVLKEYEFLTYVPHNVYQNVRHGVEAKLLLESGRSGEDLHLHAEAFWASHRAVKSLLPVELIRPLMPYACVHGHHRHQALVMAATVGHIDMVKYLIESNRVKVDEDLTESGTTCLMVAVTSFLEVVRYLVEVAGANVHLRSADDKSVFMIAAEYGRLDIMEYLWYNGHVDAEEWEDDYDAEIMKEVLQRAALLRDDVTLSVLKFLIDTAGCDPKKIDSSGYSVLHAAIRQNLMGVVKYLCSKTDKVDVNLESDPMLSDQRAETPLETLARHHGNVEMAKVLVHYGAEATCKRVVEMDPWVNNSGPYETGAFIEAVRMGHLDLVRYFVGILENHRGDLGWSYKYELLTKAARTGNLDLIRYALEEVKIDVNIKDHTENKDTPAALHCSAAENFEHVTEYLIANNADVNLRLVDWTPLMMVARTNARRTAKQLLDTGRADMNAVNESGKSALIIAIEYGRISVAQLLLERGADPNVVTADGQTALMIALQNDDDDDVVQLLLDDPRVDVLAPDGDGMILEMASDMGNVEVTDALINSGKFNTIFSSDKLDRIRHNAMNASPPEYPSEMLEEMFSRLNMVAVPITSDDDEFDSDDDSYYYDSDEDDFDFRDVHYDEDGNYYEMGGMGFDAYSGLGGFPFPVPPGEENFVAFLSSMLAGMPPGSTDGSDASADIPSVRETPPEDNIRGDVQSDNEPGGASSTAAAAASNRSNRNRQSSRRGRGRRGGRRGRR